jgi:hypothetical protein
MRTAPVLLVAACLFTGGLGGRASAERAKNTTAPNVERAPKVDPEAERVLHDMSEFLSQQKAFEVEADGSTDVVLENKQKVETNREAHIYVERPNKVRVDRKGDLADAQIFYDGKTVTIYAKSSNAYAQRPAPPTIDATVDELYDKLDMDLGPGDLLSENPEKTLMEDVVSGKYLGRSVIDDVPTHHLAMRGHEIDWELWVEEGSRPLPRKYVITSKKVEGSPQYAVTMSNWKLVADLPDDTFTFTPPEDARKIDFVDQVKGAKKPESK